MGKHEEKEGGRQYIRSILTLTVIFNSAPRFAKWAEFLCSPRTYSFQIGYVFSTWFSILHLFFSCNSSIEYPRKDNDVHCSQNSYPEYWLSCHFCFSLDSFSAFASHGKEAVSQVLHFQKWKCKISHMEFILKFHVCSRPFDDESSLWSIAQNVLGMVSPRWRVGVSYFAYISRKSFPPIEINWKNWLPASSGWYGFCVADSRGRDQFPSIKSWDVENIHPPQIQGKYVFIIHVGDKKYQKSKWI